MDSDRSGLDDSRGSGEKTRREANNRIAEWPHEWKPLYEYDGVVNDVEAAWICDRCAKPVVADWRDEAHTELLDVDDCPVAPPEPELVVGQILAWRQWGLGNDVSWLRERHGISLPNNIVVRVGTLRSVGVGAEWDSAEIVASCNPRGKHTAPHKDCLCGLYAFKFSNLIDYQYDYNDKLDSRALDTYNTVYGAVALTGKVIEHQLGYRAEKARILKCWVARSNFHDRIEPSLIVLDEKYDPVNVIEVVDDVFATMLEWHQDKEAK